MTDEKTKDDQVEHIKIADKQIDFTIKKSEGEWQDTIDDFFIKGTPKVFEWMRWIIVLAVIDYIDRISDSIIITTVHIILYMFTYGYFMVYFFQIKFIISSKQKSLLAGYRDSAAVSAVFTLVVWLLVSQSIDAISDMYPLNKTGKNNQEITSSIQTSNTSVETDFETDSSEIKLNNKEIPKNEGIKVEQPEVKLTVKTITKERINSSTQPTETLTNSNTERKLQDEKSP